MQADLQQPDEIMGDFQSLVGLTRCGRFVKIYLLSALQRVPPKFLSNALREWTKIKKSGEMITGTSIFCQVIPPNKTPKFVHVYKSVCHGSNTLLTLTGKHPKTKLNGPRVVFGEPPLGF